MVPISIKMMRSIALIPSVPLILLCQSLVESSNTLGIPGTRPLLKSQGEGSPNGTIFDDVTNISSPILNVRSIAIISMYQVDYAQFNYTLVNGHLYSGPPHGDGLFVAQGYPLDKDEYISKIEGNTNYKMINQITFTISTSNQKQSRLIGPFGSTVGVHNFTFEGVIVGFHGKTGLLLQNLGVYYFAPAKQSKIIGQPGRANFNEHPDTLFPPVIKVSEIMIHHSHQVNSIQLQYQLHGGGFRLGKKHGGAKGKLTTIKLDEGEELIEVRGKTTKGTHKRISQLTFISKKSDGQIAYHGPFGRGGVRHFSLQGSMIGYVGRASDTLESLGIYYY